ncbi:hypothetical protein M406DRAFT_329428 [Cryphonectria parasitica EP155]|uniref:Delta(14)-sterol reductase n=1 Tax=Cryphonectria parasitica (strain ATCC 38755 / EP155) TaxID=660469 RepID=A0A9P5CPK7_CRYP1|nr:uncharacterized protein M406DRAFT_329428 [Cryphonectria parasitica EP155]KAF3765527.1 hypothetical protein M406DRAFT_329428 [Cryphonectria parasitica EP155]
MLDTKALLFSPLLELFILIAHLALPAREVEGYVRDAKDKPLKYRLNGILVLAATVLSWAGLCTLDILPWDFLHAHLWETCASACTTGLICTTYLVATSSDPGNPSSETLASQFFLGRTLTPRLTLAGRVLDIKMLLYVIGAVHLELNLLSYAAAHHLSSPDDPNPGVALAAAFLSWFVCDYLFWENVQLYTYDLFAERVGFKLVWGCMCFYPFFYPVSIAAAVTLPNPHRGTAYYALAVGIYFTGWGLSRGANLQKFEFKRASAERRADPRRTIRSKDGRQELFCGGLWGVARHVNYIGEILEAVAIALAVGHPMTAWTPWLYPLYYVGLLVTRERDDDKRCRDKYGPLWEEYCLRVPYRLIPFVY